MPRWALVVKQLHGSGNYTWVGTDVLDTVDGTLEQALAALWHHATTYKPEHPYNLRRRVVCRDGDGFLVVGEGGKGKGYHCEFRVHEMLWDSGPLTGR